MYGSMQKPHGYGLFCNLIRPVFSQKLRVMRRKIARSRWAEKRVNVKNEALMQKTNHQMLMMNVISGTIQA
ncbi:Uncharacterised protein [Citrobacter freundii]|nr:Uncharacterised protein [Citrobacter freundii]SUX72750.1 Uncharacterised protein [Citrobacter freundii]